MKKTVAKIISLIAVLTLLASVAIPAQAAKKPEFMLALGDSITTGFGLENYMEGDDAYKCDSYITLVANAMGLIPKESYVNKAVNGATSTDLLALLPDLTKQLGYSDLIVVTIGGNDLLGAVPIVASAISGKNITSLGSAIDVLTAATQQDFAALSNNANFQRQMGSVLTKFANNLAGIAQIIKKDAPNARVIFLKQYNPMKNVIGFGDFGIFADTLIAQINASIDQVCAASGFEVLDAPSVIDINAVGLTNMLNYDIHPNAAGHLEIAKLLASHLGISLDASENTFEEATTAAPETDPETEPVTEPTTEVVPTETAPVEEEKGCASAVSSAAIIIALCGACFVFKKKSI
jgi:lysophospholipase L1-like esterase